MSDATSAVQLYDPTGRGGLAPMGADAVIWTGEQVARAELLALVLAGLMLALLGLNLWLLADRARRRRAERELFARLAVLEAERARAQMAALWVGSPAVPRRGGVIPPPDQPGEGRAARQPVDAEAG
jgi:hypothetical protein